MKKIIVTANVLYDGYTTLGDSLRTKVYHRAYYNNETIFSSPIAQHVSNLVYTKEMTEICKNFAK